MGRFASFLCLAAFILYAAASAPPAIDLAYAQGDQPAQVDPSSSLAPVLGRVTPAVVSISIQPRASAEDSPLYRDPFFRRYFDSNAGRQRDLSAGSGVIVDAEQGYIVTNHHIVANAREITVTLNDGRRMSGDLIGSDAVTDIALVKIEAKGLNALPTADPEELSVGDYVVAVGNPFGAGETIATGIVGALGPGLDVGGPRGLIQVNTPITPGNSGGALVNLRGQLVGVNSAIAAPGSEKMGIGFAVPWVSVQATMQKLVARDDRQVSANDELWETIELVKGGEVTIVTVIRSESDAPLEARIDAAKKRSGGPTNIIPTRSSAARGMPSREAAGPTPLIPATTPARRAAGPTNIMPKLTDSLVDGAALRDRPANGGVVVASVDPAGPAWRDGLRQGDVITSVDRNPVRDLAALETQMGTADNTVIFEVRRNDKAVVVVLRR
ncbi:MAG: trypsin-like peptidase domain-containing protein [Rhodospirillales bacterium]|nr:MAG: trypsin-like peptidase domain-containing protein [Rhodospirillales bacterium]